MLTHSISRYLLKKEVLETLDREELELALEEAPYAHLLQLLKLKFSLATSPEQSEAILHECALYHYDRQSLYQWVSRIKAESSVTDSELQPEDGGESPATTTSEDLRWEWETPEGKESSEQADEHKVMAKEDTADIIETDQEDALEVESSLRPFTYGMDEEELYDALFEDEEMEDHALHIYDEDEEFEWDNRLSRFDEEEEFYWELVESEILQESLLDQDKSILQMTEASDSDEEEEKEGSGTELAVGLSVAKDSEQESEDPGIVREVDLAVKTDNQFIQWLAGLRKRDVTSGRGREEKEDQGMISNTDGDKEKERVEEKFKLKLRDEEEREKDEKIEKKFKAEEKLEKGGKEKRKKGVKKKKRKEKIRKEKKKKRKRKRKEKEKGKRWNKTDWEQIFEESLTLDEEIVSEGLADLLWKHGHEEKSLEMYERLSLKYPEKSSYFAGKIKEIKKK